MKYLAHVWSCDMTPVPHRAILRLVLAAVALLTAAGTASAQASEGRLKRVDDTKTVKIAYRSDSNPFSFLNERQEPVGYTIDLCKLIVRSLEQRINAPLSIEWVSVTTRDRFAAIASGSADMECGSSTVSLSRMKEVDFSSFTFVENTAVAVVASSGIRGFNELRGKKIAVIAGTTNERALARELQRRQLSATVVQVGNREEGMAALLDGSVAAFASDRFLLGGMRGGATLTMLSEDLSVEPYAVVLPRGDWDFRLAVNTALAQIFRSSEILDIFTRWFGGVTSRPNVLIGAVYILGALPD
jgi:glutamate/aspartate transport system substrate-binding protein